MKFVSHDDAVVAQSATVNTDQVRAKQLLAAAGYPDGAGFPVIHLLINRNEQQRQVAQAVAAMWRSTLKVETEIVVKSWDEYEAAIRAGDYDLARRGAVMRSADEFSNITMLFPTEEKPGGSAVAAAPGAGESGRGGNQEKGTAANSTAIPLAKTPAAPIETEAEAIRELNAIPIYFASSYALVKPYVVGFDSNILDAPSLKNVRINTAWQEPKTNSPTKPR
jgi:ABC-type transport system substrate-binding protein